MNERSVWSDELRWLIFMSYVDVLVGIRLVEADYPVYVLTY